MKYAVMELSDNFEKGECFDCPLEIREDNE